MQINKGVEEMTRNELKEHCERQIRECERYAEAKGEKPSGKVYEEHILILSLLEPVPCEYCVARKEFVEAVLDTLRNMENAFDVLDKLDAEAVLDRMEFEE